tara:strand:- start:136 stop:570 length:435 start_codon:yes stop_codon:yes gene_type:complete
METLEKLEDKELLKDLFTTAIEGGIDYWSNVTAYKHSIDDWFATIETDDISEDDDGDLVIGDLVTLKINESTIFKGIKLLAKETDSDREDKNIHPDSSHANIAQFCKELIDSSGAVNKFDDWGYDCCDADMIVQMGLFKEVIYG